jgi:3,4-dihydroxy 2-butanone 4-phosphate synthase/GTP cyclohydrolase II
MRKKTRDIENELLFPGEKDIPGPEESIDKIRAYAIQDQGRDTVEANLRLGFSADAREYGIGSQILADLGLTTIRVLTNNPKKISGISGFGLSVVSQEPIEIEPNPENREYLDSKRDKMGHTIGGPEPASR